MRDKLNKSIKNNISKMLSKIYINDKLSFDNTYEDNLTKDLKGTFYKLTNNVTFVIPDKLESCYNGNTYTLFTLIINDFTFKSRDTITWSAERFGQFNINENLTDMQELTAISKFFQ
jgi:hypothetical protein